MAKNIALIYLLSASVLLLLLASCGGGSGESGQQEPDPVAIDLPIAYVKRALPLDEEGQPVSENILEPDAFIPGAELYLRERASAEAAEILITEGVFEEGALYDIKDVSTSYDGNKLLFSMRAPEIEGLDEDEQPTWNIWEYDHSQNTLRRVISSETTAEAGQDISPRYLADGRIVFSSTRQVRAKAILLDENKPQYEAQTESQATDAFNLHLMDEDGTNIKQISFNQSHDLYPTPLEDGRILYLRWDAAGSNDSLSFYSTNPDGSQTRFVYGFHSQDTGTEDSEVTFWNPVELPEGLILAIQKSRSSEIYGGDLISIDIENFTELEQEKTSSTADESQGQKSMSVLEVTTDGSASPHGLFTSAYPLYDGTSRYLVSWSQCRIQDEALTEILPCTEENLANGAVTQADPLYGLWMYDLEEETQQPIVTPEEGIMVSHAVVMESRPTPLFIADLVAETDLETEQVGLMHIRSVYDIEGMDTTSEGIEVVKDPSLTSADQRPARFLRIEKAVSIPDDDVYDFNGSAFGAGGSRVGMREIVGYVEIEPDGSVLTKVPTNVALAVSVLDANGRRISERHENWMTASVGETVGCNGCHTGNSEIAHGRPDAEPESINAGAETSGLPFANTNPVLIAEISETMAQTYGRINGYRTPSVDIEFIDAWADPAITTPADSFEWGYADLQTQAPASDACIDDWDSLCRIVINYPTHIQPLWDLERPIFDDMGVETDNYRCTICHSEADIDGFDQVPAAQLDLRANQSVDNINYATSYQELFFQNDEQILDDMGDLIFRLVKSGEFETDEDGELILDEFGDPIPILVRVPVASLMRSGGARASSSFFAPFSEGGTHAGYLSDSELKLLSEWLDIGGQYYNNPFDAPAD